MRETARGFGGFVARRRRAAEALWTAARFTLLYLTRARRVRRRYAEAEREGRRLVLDDGPFALRTVRRDETPWP